MTAKLLPAMVLFLFACHDSDSKKGTTNVTISHGGMTRSFIVQMPENANTSGSYPVLFAFHGGQGTNSIYPPALENLINEKRWIGVYPQGVGGFWNADIGTSTVDDTGFVRAIVSWLSDREPIDENKIYATGFSNGAILSHKIARESDIFAAIAPVNGSWLAGQTISGNAPAIAVMQCASLNDEIVPYHGGSPQGLNFQSVTAMTDGYANHNGCTLAKDTLQNDVNVSVFEYLGCSDTQLKIYRMNQKTHFLDDATWSGLYPLIFDFLEGKSKN